MKLALTARLRSEMHPAPMSLRQSPVARSTILALLVAIWLFAPERSAFAAAVFPSPGGARGTDTGDAFKPFAGLAEPASANVFRGAASVRIPIEVPPGKPSAVPELALQYNSATGRSPLGRGWSVPLATIRRSAKYGVPSYDDDDVFVLDLPNGSVELRAIPGTPRFEAQQEGAFLRIGFDRDNNRWRVVDKAGTTFSFGARSESRSGINVAKVAGTAVWRIDSSWDGLTNRVDYTYETANGGSGTTEHIQTIRYGHNTRAGTEAPFLVSFLWSARSYPSEPTTSFRNGYADREDSILTAIETRSQNVLVRRYSLSHQIHEVTGEALLVGVSLDAFGDQPAFDVALPSTVFDYAAPWQSDWPFGDTSQRHSRSIDMVSPGAFRDFGSNVDYDTFDIDGDARVDYIDTRTNPPTVRRGTESGFDPPQPWAWPDSPRRIRKLNNGNDLVVHIFDITGDGLPDLVDAREHACGAIATWCVYENTGDGFADVPLPWPAPHAEIRVADTIGERILKDLSDLNGDGLPDAVDATGYDSENPSWIVHWNTGNGFSSTPSRFPAPGPLISRSNVVVDTAYLLHGLYDMNGDGLPDYVNADPNGSENPSQFAVSAWRVHLNTGYGFTDTPLLWRVEGETQILLPNYLSVVETETGASTTTVDLIDLSGDGRPDWVRNYSGADYLAFGLEAPVCRSEACPVQGSESSPACCFPLLVFVNTGSSFSAPANWGAWDEYRLRSVSKEPESNEREFDLFDFDGDGLIDLVEILHDRWFVYSHPAVAIDPVAPDLPRVRPGLLVSMMNGIGGETHLDYAPVSASSLSRLPFPYWVIVEREIRDGVFDIGAGHTRYAYRDAKYDSAAREFRGFGAVAETDSAGRITVTEFLQEAPLAGRVSSVRLLGNPGCQAPDVWTGQSECNSWSRILRSEDNVWQSSPYATLATRITIPHSSGVAIPELARRIDYEYDLLGNVTRETVSSPSATAVETETSYEILVKDDANGMPDRYFANRPSLVRTVEPSRSTTPLLERNHVYDFSETRFGTLVETRICTTFQGTNCTAWDSSRFRHDRFGNVVSLTATGKATTRSSFDDLGIYAVRTKDAAGITTTTTRDLRHGAASASTGSDGRSFQTVFDGLGRPLLSWQNDGSIDDPDVEAWYFDASPDGKPGHVRIAERGTAPTSVFFDGLGRRVATKTLAETENGIDTVVSGIREYSEAGELARESIGFIALDPDLDRLVARPDNAPAFTEFSYDTDARLVETRFPDGSRTEFHTSVPGVRITAHPNLLAGQFAGSATIEFLDGLGRVWHVTTCRSMPTSTGQCPDQDILDSVSWEYDGLDRPISTKAGTDLLQASVKQWAYDGAGNRVGFSSSDLGTWSYEYGPGGLMTSAVDPRGITIQNRFDKAGRLKRQRGETFRANYKYHRRGPGIGQLRRVKSKSLEVSVRKDFEYDTRSRIAEERLSIKHAESHSQTSFTYGYDSSDRRTTVTYPAADGETAVLETSLGVFGMPRALVLHEHGASRTIVADTKYDEFGRMVRIDYANGLGDRFEYDNAAELGRLRCIRTAAVELPGTACTPHAFDHRAVEITGRDTSGNVTAITDQLRPGSILDASIEYRYDALGRLVESRGAVSPLEAFAYDDNGNLVQKSATQFTYQPGAPHRPVLFGQTGIAHDAAGNRVLKGDWNYRYDDMNRLIGVNEANLPGIQYFYDEGQTRVARYDESTGRARHYVFGFVEIEGNNTVRHFHFGGRIVASDSFRNTAETSTATSIVVASLGSLVALLALLGWMPNPAPRARIAAVTAAVVLLASIPWQFAVAAAPVDGDLKFLHVDTVGSPVLLSDGAGRVLEHRRYSAFGTLEDVRTDDGVPITASSTERGFAGHTIEAAAGLIYTGARFYDADLGMFLTPDPAAEFRSPYLYGGGNPVNGADANGESVFGFLIAVLTPILTSAAISAIVSGFVSSFDGGSFAQGLSTGFVSGLIGAGLGTLAGGLNVGYQFAAGGSRWIAAGEALGAITEVAQRSAFTSALTNSAVTAGDAAGLGSDWKTALGVATGLIGSYAYDRFVIKESGRIATSFASQREMARNGVQPANTRLGHTNITAEAATGTGWERHTADLVRANVAQDGEGTFLDNAQAVLTNEEHFGRLPASIGSIRSSVDGASTVFQSPGLGVSFQGAQNGLTNSLGRASHFIQDHLTLGHMVPGTRAFGGPLGAPIRFVIHQVFGGEIAFRDAQIRATRDLLTSTPNPT